MAGKPICIPHYIVVKINPNIYEVQFYHRFRAIIYDQLHQRKSQKFNGK